jgi:hypothetical protein
MPVNWNDDNWNDECWGNACGVYIGVSTQPIYTEPGSLSVENAIEERSTCSVTVVDEDGVASYSKGTPIWITKLDEDGAGVGVFDGLIEAVTHTKIAPGDSTIYHQLTCVDWHYLADKRIVSRTYTNQTCGFMVNDILTQYLAAEGVTAGTVEAGPVVLEAIFNYVKASEAIQRLAEAANFWWIIDRDKKLHFRARSALAAPWTVTSADLLKGSIKVLEGNPQYRNRQFMRGGRDLTDPQVEQFPGDGKREAFTVGFPIAKVPTIKVNTITKTVAIKGLGTVADWYWSKGDPVVVQDNAGVRLTTADTLEVTYEGLFSVVTLSTDTAEIESRKAIEGGTGYVEEVENALISNTREQMFELAAARLMEFARGGRKVSFRTRRSGLEPGQLVTIDLPYYDVSNAQFLIGSVGVVGDRETVFEVEGVEGPWQGSWQRLFTDLAFGAEAIIESVNAGSDETLTVLAQFAESWAWAELVTQTVFACPIPATTLLPSTTLLPC